MMDVFRRFNRHLTLTTVTALTVMFLTGCGQVSDQVARIRGTACDMGIVLVDNSSSVKGTESFRSDQAAAAISTSLTSCHTTRLVVFGTTLSLVNPGTAPDHVETKQVVDAVTGAWITSLTKALNEDQGSGSDVVNALRFADQLAGDRPSSITVVTDGLSTVPALGLTQSTVNDPSAAAAAIKAAGLPDLGQSTVTLVGVGAGASATPVPPEVKAALTQAWGTALANDKHPTKVMDLLDSSTGAAGRSISAYKKVVGDVAPEPRSERSLGGNRQGHRFPPLAAAGLLPWWRGARKRRKKQADAPAGWIPAGEAATQVVATAAVDDPLPASADELSHQLHAVRSSIRVLQHGGPRMWLAGRWRSRHGVAALALCPQVDTELVTLKNAHSDCARRQVVAEVVDLLTAHYPRPALSHRVASAALAVVVAAEAYGIYLAFVASDLSRAVALSPLAPVTANPFHLFVVAMLPAAGMVAVGWWWATLVTRSEPQTLPKALEEAHKSGRARPTNVLAAVSGVAVLLLAVGVALVRSDGSAKSTLLYLGIAVIGPVVGCIVHLLSTNPVADLRRRTSHEYRDARKSASKAANAPGLKKYFRLSSRHVMSSIRAQADWDARDGQADGGMAVRAARAELGAGPVFVTFETATPGSLAVAYSRATLTPDIPIDDFAKAKKFSMPAGYPDLEQLVRTEKARHASLLLKQLGLTSTAPGVREYLEALVDDTTAGKISNGHVVSLNGSRGPAQTPTKDVQ